MAGQPMEDSGSSIDSTFSRKRATGLRLLDSSWQEQQLLLAQGWSLNSSLPGSSPSAGCSSASLSPPGCRLPAQRQGRLTLSGSAGFRTVYEAHNWLHSRRSTRPWAPPATGVSMDSLGNALHSWHGCCGLWNEEVMKASRICLPHILSTLVEASHFCSKQAWRSVSCTTRLVISAASIANM